MDNRPQGRERRVTGPGKPVAKRGDGLGTGPVGNAGGYNRGSGSSSGGGNRAGGGGGGLLKIIILIIALLGGGGGALGIFGGSGETAAPAPSQTVVIPTTPAVQQPAETKPSSGVSLGGGLSAFFGGANNSGWLNGNNTGRLNTTVSSEARAKRTELVGGGKDTMTIMVYMCGTDLESKSGMATKDLQEMLAADLGSNVNLLVYTGGCSKWRNNIISSSANQIYKVENGGLVCLQKDAGSAAMTAPKNLASFIQFCTKNYPANRNMLILWDHGGGSISGYGYDEKNRSAGSMPLKGLDQALSEAGTTFDVIGFDACLMATLETGLTMAPYADYLLASEETEPGLGWYYTDWLTALSKNPSMPTTELGKRIADDFVAACARSCPGQKTTLSLVDLAELEKTVPDDFKAFSSSTLAMLKNDGYTEVSGARSSAREFGASSKIDQVDLVHLALKLDTDEGKALADAVLSAVKYNKTSSDMTNAYGLSLYFPYQKVGNVKNAVAAFDAIGMDNAYTDCIRAFASLEASGQAAGGSTGSPVPALNGQGYSTTVSGDALSQLLGQFLSGQGGLLGSAFDRSLDADSTVSFLENNRLDPDSLFWSMTENGSVLHLTERQWSMIRDLELNVFVDDGEGYIDLGLDNVFDFTEEGDLLGTYDGTWLAIDSQPVAYYHTNTTYDETGYTITGRVPVLLNGSRAELILVFTTQEPYGYIAGARPVYTDGETDTVAKGITELEVGDTIDFICDYYRYDGTYEDSYLLGETYTWTGEYMISNVYVQADVVASYRVLDIYNGEYWTPVIPAN